MGKYKKKDLIPEPKPPEEQINFSFRYYDTRNNKYCISCWEKHLIAKALNALKDISNKTYGEINHSRTTYHFYPVRWEQTIEKSGFPCRGANELEAFHFALVGVNGQLARVYGSLYKNTFYIIWFDLNHIIWPSFKSYT